MSPATQIILFDKNKDTFLELKDKFKEMGFNLIAVQDKKSLFRELDANKTAAVLMDLNHTESDAIVTCQEIRNKNGFEQPFILIYADKNEDYVQITAFNSGADDFLIKPLKAFLVTARIKAMLRRQTSNIKKPQKNQFKYDIYIDHDRFKVVRNNKSITLTRKEFDLINLLYSTPNKVFSREEIATELWNDEQVARQRTIDIHVRNIRKRVGKEVIKTLKGIGYCAP